MAQDTSLNGMRRSLVTQIYGPRLALGPGNSSDFTPDYLVGPRAFREQVEGVSSAGSTVVSTSVANNLSPYGMSLVGATGASATTAYNLAAPVPGVTKRIFNPTTGTAVVLTTGAGAFINSTGSVTSTLGVITLTAKGSFVELYALTTGLWAVTGISQISTGGIGVTLG